MARLVQPERPEMEHVRRNPGLRDSSHHMRLVGRFVLISFVAIVATTATLSVFLSSYLTRQMPLQDAIEATESLNALVRAEGAERGFYEGSHGVDAPGMATIIRYLQHLPDVYLATIYRANGVVLWSTDESLTGLRTAQSAQLTAALSGELDPEVRPLAEEDEIYRTALPADATSFVTFALPVWSRDQASVIGAVEIRKVPETLLGSIDRVSYLTWGSEAAAGMVLFCGLLIVMLYTSRVLRQHEARLIEMQRMAVVGEMASSVAHGLRNPLAAIRSCAELVLDGGLPKNARGPISDIVEQSDRLESWIRSFLTRAREDPHRIVSPTDVDKVIRKCLGSFSSQMKDRRIVVDFVDKGHGPLVTAEPTELEQVLNSVLSNSVEALREGGRIRIARDVRSDGRACILIKDNGPGIPDEMLERLFSPFETGKPTGLGVGLVLARQILERLGGTLELRNRKKRGVAVLCVIPTFEVSP